jgi:hypothetical protein
MTPSMSRAPLFAAVTRVERLSARRVRLYFTDGLILETTIPVHHASCIRVIDGGIAVKFGAGPMSEVASDALARRPGRVLAKSIYPRGRRK